MAQLYLGQWETERRRDEWSWRPPLDCISVIDRRSMTQQAVHPSQPAEGYAFFAYPGPRVHPRLLIDLGDRPDVLLTIVQANAVNALLGVNATRDTFARMLRQIVLDPTMTDPAGVTLGKPLRGSRRHGITTSLPPWGALFAESWTDTHPGALAAVAVFRADYARNRETVNALPPAEGRRALEALQRYTGATMRALYGRMDATRAAALLPHPYKGDGFREPQTSFTETWPTVSTTISSGQDQPWTEVVGDSEVATGNYLRPTATTGVTVRCNTALSTDDHEHEATATLTLESSGVNPTVRHSTSATTYYMTQGFRETGSMLRRLLKTVAAVQSTLATDSTDPGTPVVLKCSADSGDIIRAYYGGVNVHTADQSASSPITGNLNIGVVLRGEVAADNARVDGHTAADLAAAGAPLPLFHRYYAGMRAG